MKSRLRLILGSIATAMIIGCGSMNTVSYYEPFLKNMEGPTEKAGDGISFTVGNICLHVSEGDSKNIHPRAMTLVGVPLLPVSFESSKNEAAYFDVRLWLVPKQGETNYDLIIPQIFLEFDNGERIRPNAVQVSQFKTTFEKKKVYAFKTGIVEKISYPEHWQPKPLRDFKDPLKIWDWTRLNMRFEKPKTELTPLKLQIHGLLLENKFQRVPDTSFVFKSEIRQAFPGRWADGVSLTDYPHVACRKLQKSQAD